MKFVKLGEIVAQHVLDMQDQTLTPLFDRAVTGEDDLRKQLDEPELEYNEDEGWSEEAQLYFEALDALKEGQKTYAGAIFLVLSRIVQDSAYEAKGSRGSAFRAGKAFGSVTLAQILWAAANNFRHYQTWPRDPKAVDSITMLKAIGIDCSQSENVCKEVLEKLGCATYEELKELVKSALDDIWR